MEFKITNKDGVTFKTKNKYVKEDIAVSIDESFVQPQGTLDITEKGEHNVKEYESVNVNVASSGGGTDYLAEFISKKTSLAYFCNAYQGTNIDFLSNYDISHITNMSYMFNGCTTLTTIPQLNTSNVTNMSNMFNGCTSLPTIIQLDTSKVTSMSYMFNGCTALTTIPQLNTSNVTNMSYMFQNCTALITIPQLSTGNVTNMSYMFNGCSALTSVSQLDTSSVTNMTGMFQKCTLLKSVPQLDTSNATSLSSTFSMCKALEKIDITYYNISATTKISVFASSCTLLKALIIRTFGTNYVINSNSLTSSGIANGTGYIYVPRSMVDTLKSATNWSTYASQIRALEDYTIDGTTTGALDESKI